MGLEDPDLINARAEHVIWHPGGAAISHTDAFSIVRSGRLDVAVLGALQVSEGGDLANWMVPSKGIGSPGGALDMSASAKRLIAIMEHSNNGRPKILRQCNYPLTVAGRVNLIVTDIAVIEVTEGGLVLKEHAPGWTVEAIQAETEPSLKVVEPVKEMDFGVPEETPPSKVYPTSLDAVSDIFDGAVILMDGFGGIGGMAHYLMLALRGQWGAGINRRRQHGGHSPRFCLWRAAATGVAGHRPQRPGRTRSDKARHRILPRLALPVAAIGFRRGVPAW